MAFESNKIFHHKTRTQSCDRISSCDNAEEICNKNKSSFKQSLNPKAPFSNHQNLSLFHRSNSVTIPVSKQFSSSASESIYSRSYNCGHSTINNYGSIDNGICTENKIFKPLDKRKLSTSESDITSEDEESGNASDIVCFGFTKRQLKVFFSLVLLSLNEIMGYSAIAPFFPVVAESKGLSATSYGLIFAAYSLCGIVSSLITGTVLVKVGAKFCVMAGMFWNTGAIFCFGFLDKTSTIPFLVLAIITRGLMGFGSNGAFTAMFAIIFQEFDDRAITVLSLSESLVGVGGMVAPLIGGGLYDIGGFITPFMVIGSFQVILLIASWYMLPHVPIQDRIASRPPFYLLTHSSALISTLVVIYIFTANSFIISNMGPFLTNEFQLDATMIGVVLLVSSVFYAGMSPIWGYIADRWKNSYLMEVGTLVVAIGMTLVGPALFLRRWFGWDHQRLWLVYVTAGVMGTFFGGALMPTFNEMLTAATELRLSDTVLAQYGLVSGLWNMSFALGDILGPSLGGVLEENFGFPRAAAILAVGGVFLTALKLLHRFYRHTTRHKRNVEVEEEQAPLLADSDTSPVVV